MSMDPNMMQAMLAQGLGGGGAAPVGGMQPQTNGVNAAAQLSQKLMLMNALQKAQQQQQAGVANAMLPGTKAQIATDPTMLALQNQTPQMPPPPTAGGIPNG